jgi:hypothetical protein
MSDGRREFRVTVEMTWGMLRKGGKGVRAT